MIEIMEQCRYQFTRDEMVDIAKRQAGLMNELIGQNETFDQLKADHKSKVSAFELGVSDCTRRITSGFEMRPIKVLVLKFRPDKDSALLIRLDNGRVLRKRKLAEDEKQLKITEQEPETWAFEADFFEDGESDVSMMVATAIPLTAREADALREIKEVEIRPRRKLLDAGKDAKRKG